jgi:phosphonoacetaldehyde hydrolase
MSYRFSRRYQGSIQAVVFDWAGTIVDYGSCAPAEAFIKLFQMKGIHLTNAEVRVPMGTEKRAHIRALLSLPRVKEEWHQKFGSPWTETSLDQLYQDFIPLQIEAIRSNTKLIPGVLEVTKELRTRGIKVGTTTGYNSDMIGVVVENAKVQGFVPDCTICSSDVSVGRPSPWMLMKALERLNVFPMESVVKVGDTGVDIEEGLNAGSWAIGVAQTGNELGLSENEVGAMSKQELEKRLTAARSRLFQAGAHVVVNGVWELIPALEDIQRRISFGERP